MVLRSQRDGLGSSARPPGTVQAGPGEFPTYPRWGSEVEHRGPTRKAVRLEVGSECVVRHSPGSMAGQGAWEKASRGPVAEQNKRKQKIIHPALLRGKEWCGHHLLKSRIQRLRVARLRDAACPGISQAWQGRRRAEAGGGGLRHFPAASSTLRPL